MFTHEGNGDKEKGNVVVFMAFMFLFRFLLFEMSELEWILLDTG
jgi:hypothetical protein